MALIGHNGSGKTTFLRMAAGLLEPSGGAIELFGHPVGSIEARAAVSYVSDNPTFYEDLSVWEHLEYVARLHGRDDWEQDAADLLGHLGLYERADDLPVTFSRGLRQKTALTIGLIRPYELFLIDEPFVGLDAAGKAALLELLQDADRAKRWSSPPTSSSSCSGCRAASPARRRAHLRRWHRRDRRPRTGLLT